MTPLVISNRQARRLWLATNGLIGAPTGPVDAMAIINRLGFVQIDTIRNVTRAHHHILWSRNQNYREKMLWPLLGRERQLFEHFTHDASLIPMSMLPVWKRQFRRLGDKVARHEWYQSGLAKEALVAIRARIETEGPLSTHAFDTKINGPREMWARPPHKKALDQMWYSGELATSHRENFVKFYDLGHRVFSEPVAGHKPNPTEDKHHIDRLCTSALERLSFASQGEIQRFWGAMDAPETRSWLNAQTELVPVDVIGADRNISRLVAPADIETRLAALGEPGLRMRLLNPFDPAIRDRNRLERLFGFDYRNEMFVPAAQRRWGYYVYPLLEGDRFVGRIELKGDRAKGVMSVTGFWPEPGVQWPKNRFERLDAELDRFARLAGLTVIIWHCARSN